VEQQPAEEQSEGRFQAHDHRCLGGFQMLLTNDLQGVGNAHGQDARIEQGEPTAEDIRPVHILCQDHHNGRQHCADKALDEVEPDSVKAKTQTVHDGDLHREEKGTAQQHQIRDLDAL